MNFLDDIKNDVDTGTVFIHKLTQLSEQREWKLKFSPSSLCYNFCPRLYSLMSLGLVSGYSFNNAQSIRRMNNGTAMHTRYDEYVKKLDLAYKDTRYGDSENDYRCAERLLEYKGIRGRYDVILEHTDGHLYVTDFKSIQQHGNAFTPGFNELTAPMESHRKQLQIYMGMIDALYDLDKPISGLLVYEGKSEQNLKEFKVPWTDNGRAGFAELIRLIQLTQDAVASEDISQVPCLCKKKDKCQDWNLDELQALKELGTPKRLKL